MTYEYDDDLFQFDMTGDGAGSEEIRAEAAAAGRQAAAETLRETAEQAARAQAAHEYFASEQQRILDIARAEYPNLDEMLRDAKFFQTEPLLAETVYSALNFPQYFERLPGILKIAARVYQGYRNQPQPGAQGELQVPAAQNQAQPPGPPLAAPNLASSRDRKKYIAEFEKRYGDVQI